MESLRETIVLPRSLGQIHESMNVELPTALLCGRLEIYLVYIGAAVQPRLATPELLSVSGTTRSQ